MPLEISKGSLYLAALFPPGNVAAELQALRRLLLERLDAAVPLPFPCAAGLAWFESLPQAPSRLEELAFGAPRLYDRYRLLDGILYLGPAHAGIPPSRFDGSSSLPLAAGAGFPLVRLTETAGEPFDPTAHLPDPPRIAFRTFQAVLVRLSWGMPWHSAMRWEFQAAVRYPLRKEHRSSGCIPGND